jgi:hypothetical protein
MTTAQALAARWNNQQIAAIHLAIAALERERRRLYAAGNAAYNQGIRTDVVNSDGVTGAKASGYAYLPQNRHVERKPQYF